MHISLYSYLEQSNVIYNLQYDFRNSYSDMLALLEITVRENLEKEKIREENRI